jgi:hypothetical protein
MSVERTEKHAESYPTGLFTDEMWAKMGVERVRVDKEKLRVAIDLVERFCTWIEDIRCRYPRYVQNQKEQ